MTEPLADRIKDIARQIRCQGGGDDDTTRGATFNILYDIGVEVAALTAANQELTFAFNLAGETCRKLEAERDALRAEVTKLRAAQAKDTKSFKRMVKAWRANANGHYCRTYNPEMGRGLSGAAKTLEEYLNGRLLL